jgi:hypothetical protein
MAHAKKNWRRTEMHEAHSRRAGCLYGQPASFPDVLLYRCTAGDGADCLATFDRRTVLMSRAIAGLACRIRVPVRQYQAVALLVGERSHTIRLMHREAGLSLDIERFDSLATAEEYHDRLADFLDLPVVVVAGEPSKKAAENTAPLPRRTRTLRARRPRFLMRRRSGAPVSIRRIEGREIIARH